MTAEFLLGDQYLGGLAPVVQQAGELVVFVLFYGSGALLVREITRRTGRGSRSGAARGRTASTAPRCIGAPIAVAEGLFGRPTRRYAPVPPQQQAPWLGRLGLVLSAVGYVVGAAAIFCTTWSIYQFVAGPAQLAGSVVVAAVLVIVALRLPRRSPREKGSYVLGLVVGGVGTTAFQLVRRLPGHVSPWLLSGLLVAVLVVGAAVSRLVHADALGLGTGAVLTYGWVGLTSAAAGRAAAVEQTVLVVLAVAAMVLAARRSRGDAGSAEHRLPRPGTDG